MEKLNKKIMKELSKGETIHIVGEGINVTGQIVQNDEFGLSIQCSSNTRVGISIRRADFYNYEIL